MRFRTLLAVAAFAPLLASFALGAATTAEAIELSPPGVPSLWHDLPLASTGGMADQMATDIAGDVWYHDGNSHDLVRVDSGSRAQTAFPIDPASWVLGIVGTPDGAIWFTDLRSHTINRLEPSSGTVTSHPLTGVAYTPSSLALGSDGAIWFGDPFDTKLVRVDGTGHLLFLPEPRDERILSVATAPDGRLFYTRTGSDRLGAYDLRTGTFSDLGVGATAGEHITAGASGSMWIDGASEFTEIAPDGTVTVHPFATGGPIPVRPIDLVGGDLAGDGEVELSFIDPEYGFGTLDAAGAVHFSRLDGSRTSIALDGAGHVWVNDLWGASLQWQ
ncbi:hypothetical protein [Herbiconiux sp.]|uniref:Vgb family protein n=1 Tax=Herbiconiux sp. TaxID=1871186 RepID=UPI0025BAED36|nr:hypothetical protein [Herbiconiux sp.]